MKQSLDSRPPKWPIKILNFFVKKEYLEEIEGDMEEAFHENLEKFSLPRANRIYALEMIKMLRPPLIKNLKINHQFINFDMLKSYIKISLRGLKKNMLFSSINIVGLGISMSVGILMILLLSELYSFDDFHKNGDRIYKVTTTQVGDEGEENHLGTSSFYIGNRIKEEIPGVENAAVLKLDRASDMFSADLKIDEKITRINGFFSSADFFDVFSFDLVKGNPLVTLAEPNSIVLTETTAKKLFGDVNPLGRIIDVGDNSDFKNAKVTGVIADIPANSHMRFDALVSMNTLNITDEIYTDPNNTSDAAVYLTINQQSSKKEVENAMALMMSDYNETIEKPIAHLLQPLKSIVTSDVYHNRMGPSFSQSKMYIMMGLTFIILLSACFNYTNLSLARALRRSKEVGIRKVSGATGGQVFLQFLVEALILSLFALIIGLLLFYLIRPQFLSLPNPASKGFSMFLLSIEWSDLLYFILFALVIGGIAGFQPALVLSKLKALTAFNDANKTKLKTGVSLRRVLNIFQFTMSIGLVMCAVLVHQQYKYTLNYDLGYKTENILNIEIHGDYIEQLENEYAKMPNVVETSKSLWVLGAGGAGMTLGMVKSKEQERPSPFLVNLIDDSYLAMHELSFLAGSGFREPLIAEENPRYIVVNKKSLPGLNIPTPEEAIGEMISYNNAQLQIIGVVDDFISIALTKDIFGSFAFLQSSQQEQYKTLNIKVTGNNMRGTINQLEAAYLKFDNQHPFKAEFYDENIAAVYEQEKTTYSIVSFLAFLAISISILGLLGMIVYSTESRLKEISIRKVLGAGRSNLTLLLSRDFIIITVVAALIAVPITLYIVDKLVLNLFLYRVNFGFAEILSGVGLMIAIGAITIGWQIRSVTSKNPSETLRNDS